MLMFAKICLHKALTIFTVQQYCNDYSFFVVDGLMGQSTFNETTMM
jgi:hypothetical protein